MNKSELIKNVAAKAGLTGKQAEAAIGAVSDTIAEALKCGDSVRISGFGTFERRTRAARTGVNPQTKQPISIPETKVPAFKAASAFKDAVRA